MNSRTDTFIISSYGSKIVLSMATLAVLLVLFTGFEFLSFIALAFLACGLYTFRNPERVSNFAQHGAIISLLDGKVKEIKSIENSPIDGKHGFEIVVESGFSDVCILRAPISSKLSVETLHRGAMLNINSNKSFLNETADIRFESKEGTILSRHTLGSFGFPLKFGIDGDILQNQRYGFFHNGKSSIFLPSNSRVAIKEGMKIRAGESIIGFFSE